MERALLLKKNGSYRFCRANDLAASLYPHKEFHVAKYSISSENERRSLIRFP